MFHALRIRDFRLLWAGGLISSLGSWLLILAVPAHVLLATGSVRDSGLTLAAQYAPALVLGPVAGVCADRWDRRRLMIATDLLRAGAVAMILLALAPGRLWLLYAALIAESCGGVLHYPAVQARTPAIVGTGPLLISANSLNAATDGVVRLAGGPLGGILLAAAGIRWLIGADALSYLVSASAIALTARTRHRTCRAADDQGAGRADDERGRRARGGVRALVSAVLCDLAEGLRALRAQRTARALLLVTVIFLAANASLSAVLIAFGVWRLGGTADTGFLLSCLGAGFLIGAPLMRALLGRVQPRALLAASLTGTAAGYFAMFTAAGLVVALAAAVVIGMAGSMAATIPLTTMQKVIPDRVLGRVSAVFLTGEAAATLTGSAAGPFLAQAAQFTRLAAVASLATLGAAVLAVLCIPPATQVRPGHGRGEGPPAGEERDGDGGEEGPAAVREHREHGERGDDRGDPGRAPQHAGGGEHAAQVDREEQRRRQGHQRRRADQPQPVERDEHQPGGRDRQQERRRPGRSLRL